MTSVPLLRSLGHRAFALLWTGQTVSRIGDYLYEVALAWWVLQKTGSAVAMGTVLICSFTPMLLFLLLGGVAVDRWPRVPLMLASDLARGVVVSMVAVLAATDRLEIWQVYMASVIFGFVDAFFQPAYSATVPALLPPEALPSANSLTSLSVQTGRVAGPALGAALVAAGGTPLAFALNGASFFLSAACLLPLLGPPTPQAPGAAPASVIGDLREGFATVRAAPWLLITIILAALGNILLAGPYGVALPFLVKDHLHAGVGTLGLLYALFPAGYILGSLWLGGKTRLRRRGPTAYLGLAGAGLMLLVLGLPVPLAVLGGAALLNGVGLEVFGLIWTNTLQELVPPAQLGRVASIDLLGSYALLPVGYALAGWATDQFGAAIVFMLGGGLAALLAALALLHPQIRGFD